MLPPLAIVWVVPAVKKIPSAVVVVLVKSENVIELVILGVVPVRLSGAEIVPPPETVLSAPDIVTAVAPEIVPAT